MYIIFTSEYKCTNQWAYKSDTTGGKSALYNFDKTNLKKIYARIKPFRMRKLLTNLRNDRFVSTTSLALIILPVQSFFWKKKLITCICVTDADL